MRTLKAYGIIHFFAILHAAVALVCRLTGVNDELMLTMLTILLIVLICLNRALSIEFTAASVIVVNVVGYLLGTGGAKLIGHIVASPPAVHALSTFITTEILGWGIVWFTKLFRRGDTPQPRRAAVWTPRIGLLLLAVGMIFALRLTYIELLASNTFSTEMFYVMTDKLVSNSAALILLLCVDIIYIRYMRRHLTQLSLTTKIGLLLLFVPVASAFGALVVALHLPFGVRFDFSGAQFAQLFVVTLVAEATLYSVLFMIDYALAARAVLRAERGKAHQAEFLYMKLKQQLNPHFLFNSLNILDCLVGEQKTEQASAFIRKLAGVYRYMLQNEEKTLVSLQEELAFVEMYVDLLHVRFADGFEVEVRIPESARKCSVVPCSVQLLIENAIKHNAIDPAHPLCITIVADDRTLKVSNNLRPKLSAGASLGVGLNYIRRQYLDLANTPIGIRHTDESYCVTLPLLP